MALFTDPDVIALGDLLQYESQLVQVSTTHGIDVETKIALAASDISDRLMLWLLNTGAADPQWLQRRQLGLTTVVVTPPLYRWICFASLSKFFAEAYNVQLNTRFEGKWTEYQEQAQGGADLVFQSGIGIAYSPLARPAMPNVQIGTGDLLATSLFVQTTWVDIKGRESAPSAVNGQLLPNLSSLAVMPAAANGAPPSAATAWNLYASTTDANLSLQNATPLPLSSAWQMPSTGLVSGSSPTGGQAPDFYVALSRRVLRG